MKKRIAAMTAALALAFSGVLLVQAPAAAVNATVTVSAPDAAIPEGSASRFASTLVDFQVVTPDSLEYLKYTYDVVVTGPSGNQAGRWTGDAYDSAHWQWSQTLWADSAYVGGYGTFTVTATVKFYPFEGNVPSDTRTVTDAFAFSGPPAPAPAPPPPPAPVVTQIDGKLSSATYYKSLRKVSLVVQSEYRTPAANETGTPVRWQLLVKGRVVRELSQSWSDTDALSARFPRARRTKYVPVQLKENGVVVFKRSYRVKGRNA